MWQFLIFFPFLTVYTLQSLDDLSDVTSTEDSRSFCDSSGLRPSTKFRWTIENFGKQPRNKIISDKFSCGEFNWYGGCHPIL